MEASPEGDLEPLGKEGWEHMAHLSPVIDITSLFGVESLFRTGAKDPWGPGLAGTLADFFVYSDVARFTMPVRGKSASLDDPTLPTILSKLASRDRGLFKPIRYDLEERRTLSLKYLDEAFQNFVAWAQNNKPRLRQFLLLHGEPWIRDGHLARVRPRYVYDVDVLRGTPLSRGLASDLGVQEDDILHGFDVFLRYSLYGEMTGRGQYYLAHPVRFLPKLPTANVEDTPPPNIALSLSDAVSEMALNMTLDEYTSFLHEARGVIRDNHKIHMLNSGAMDLETTRDVAQELGLPGRLSAAGKVMSVAPGVIGIAGGVEPTISLAASCVGVLVSVASEIWTGTVGRGPSRKSWLRWALKWDIEKQVGDPNVRMQRRS